MSYKIISAADIKGFRLGNAQDSEKGTGCTVIVCEDGATGGVDVRGGGPATRETDLLRSENTVNSVNAVVLSGGSAFGLEAASGVMRELSDRGIGFDVGDGIHVPIVCGASLYDLPVGDNKAFPDIEMGREAVRNAFDGEFSHGNRGAGTGATVGKMTGYERAMKTGLGTFACGDGFIEVAAIVAVNACGDVYNGAGNIIAGLRTEDGGSIYGTIKALKSLVHEDPFSYGESAPSGVKAVKEEAFSENASNDEKLSALESAYAAMIAESSEPAADNETEAVQEVQPKVEAEAETEAEAVAEAVAEPAAEVETEAVSEAPTEVAAISEAEEEPVSEDEAPAEVFAETEAKKEPAPGPEAAPGPAVTEPEADFPLEQPEEIQKAAVQLAPEEMGYDIAFNTTIGCLITNAELTKPQANKLASILHDAYARAIKPVHGTLDGDTIFVLASGEKKVNFDAFAALATDVMQYAVIDAATSAESAYGLPAASDII